MKKRASTFRNQERKKSYKYKKRVVIGLDYLGEHVVAKVTRGIQYDMIWEGNRQIQRWKEIEVEYVVIR